MTQLDRVTIASRVFCIAAILGLSLLSRDAQVTVSVIVIGTVALAAIYVSLVTALPHVGVVTVEAIVVGLVIGLALPGGVILLPYLVVLSLVAGISRGLPALVSVILAGLIATVGFPLLFDQVDGLQERSNIFAPWFLTSLGAGLLGAWLRQIGATPHLGESQASYESARRLVTQLRTVARRLSAGLDPVSLSSLILVAVNEMVSDTSAAVFIRTDNGVLSPLIYRGDGARDRITPYVNVVDACWAEMEPFHSSSSHDTANFFVSAFPLRVGSRMIGVVVAELTAPPNPEAVASLMRELDEQSLRLDTALAFDEVRSIATVEERHRLAREIHDGVAQEVASLGYLIDDLTATAESAVQRDGLLAVRRELTRVVQELRLSIFDLRSEIMPQASLGSALSEYVRTVGARSKMTVHLTLDEASTRLRAETENELLRIAQEAITNARKHSLARNLWVDCTIQPPFASLEIRDDGTGLRSGRVDSYGLRIMKERAQRIDANLEVLSGDPESSVTGTVVRVTTGKVPSPSTHSEVK